MRQVSHTPTMKVELGTDKLARFVWIVAKNYSRDGHPCGDRLTAEYYVTIRVIGYTS